MAFRISFLAGFSCLIILIPVIFNWEWSTSCATQRREAVSRPESPGMDIRKKEPKMSEENKLTEKEGKYLIDVARKTIERELTGSGGPDQLSGDVSEKLVEKRGTFVTLTMNDQLRGCIGHIIPQESILQGVKENALNAAFRDPRFRPLSKEEWRKVKVEVSILTEPQPLDYSGPEDLLDKLQAGVDGVILKKGYHQATFLPQVWDQLPKKEEFLTHLCLKAGLEGDAWRRGDLEISTYQVQAFEE